MFVKCSADEASGLIAACDAVGVRSGFVYDGDALSVPEAYHVRVTQIMTAPTWKADVIKAALRSYAAAKRFAIETAGVVIDGRKIATDRESQAMIAGAFSFSLADPTRVFQFKTGAGFVSLAQADISALAQAVAAYVQACFAKEAEVVAAIDAGTVKGIAGIDNLFAAS